MDNNYYCCNPTRISQHKTRKMLLKKMPVVTYELVAAACSMNLDLKVGMKICKTCRSKVCKMIKDPNCELAKKFREQKLRTQKRRLRIASARRQQQEAEARCHAEELRTPRSSHLQALRRIAQLGQVQGDGDNIHMDIDEYREMQPTNGDHPGVPVHATASGLSDELVDRPAAVTLLNNFLPSIGVEPIDYRELSRVKSYCHNSMDEIASELGRKIFQINKPLESAQWEVIRQLKEKFMITTHRDEKYLILSALPLSWSAFKMRNEFGASWKLASSVKCLVDEKGILCVPNKRLARHTLPEETVNRVKQFYLRPEISYICPGKRDYVTINDNGEKLTEQRRLLLMNLKEAYKVFKEENNNCQLSFTKFTTLRPPQCILALDGAGTHNVCVCILHQNVKLIFEPMKNIFNLQTYSDLLNQMLCADAERDENCYLNDCQKCPESNAMELYLEEILQQNDISNVPYKQWIMNEGKIKNCT